MATAKKEVKIIERKIERSVFEEEKKYILEMTEDEAIVVAALVGNIGGRNAFRERTTAVFNALMAANVPFDAVKIIGFAKPPKDDYYQRDDSPLIYFKVDEPAK